MRDHDRITLILASASPRRRELLALLGLPFEVRVAGILETPGDGEAPLEYVSRVAQEKAETITNYKLPMTHDKTSHREIVIAADTEVIFEGQVLGKPKDANDACQMLARLRGRTHGVVSAVVVRDTQSGQTEEVVCQSDVPMRNYLDSELAAYVASGDPFDKAGGYAIQHDGFHPVETFEHCYASVMGLPLCHLTVALRRMRLHPPNDVALACQQFNHYPCPVHAEILKSS